MATLWTHFMECDGECGEKLEIRVHQKRGGTKMLMGIAETLGWCTRDTKGGGVDVYCGSCQKRAERIVNGK